MNTRAFGHAVAGAIVAIGLAVFAGHPAYAESLEDKIGKALQSKAVEPARPLTRSISGARTVTDPKKAEEQRFIHRVRTRAITVEPREPAAAAAAAEERAKIAEIVKDKPTIDLEIYFDYDSAVIGPKAVAAVTALGKTLSKPEFKGTVFFINGHTDGRGSAEYNQRLSQRRAEAVKRYLVEHFKLAPDTLIATGFGKEQLKFLEKPFADENRRVQIANSEVKAAAAK
jgi:outer membrane protein OmpA-like peptidoglycan-associated protein